jgi:hypothetical protein
MATWDDLPDKIGTVSQQGVDDVVDACITRVDHDGIAALLEDQPERFIRRLFSLTEDQIRTLSAMAPKTPESRSPELDELVAPAVELIRSGDLRGRLRLCWVVPVGVDSTDAVKGSKAARAEWKRARASTRIKRWKCKVVRESR